MSVLGFRIEIISDGNGGNIRLKMRKYQMEKEKISDGKGEKNTYLFLSDFFFHALLLYEQPCFEQLVSF